MDVEVAYVKWYVLFVSYCAAILLCLCIAARLFFDDMLMSNPLILDLWGVLILGTPGIGGATAFYGLITIWFRRKPSELSITIEGRLSILDPESQRWLTFRAKSARRRDIDNLSIKTGMFSRVDIGFDNMGDLEKVFDFIRGGKPPKPGILASLRGRLRSTS